MSRRVEVKMAAQFDQERQRAYLGTAVVGWIVLALFLALRDPGWRLLHDGRLVSPIDRSTIGWTEFDKQLIRRLTSVRIEPVAGEASLEDAVGAALDRRRAASATSDEPPAAGIEESQALRDIARVRARARLELPDAAEVTAPELLYPATYMGLVEQDRLIHVVEIYQRLPASASTAWPGLADELVGGWLNRARFRSAVTEGEALRIGVGAVSAESGDTVVVVLLEETFAILDAALPPFVPGESPYTLSGRKLAGADIALYFKGPSDPGFYPMELEWQNQSFSRDLEWSQGAGNYALRVGRNDRLSDPRPILVE